MPADARGDARRRGQNYGSSASFGPVNGPGFAEGIIAPGQKARLVDVTLLPEDDPLGSWVVTLQGDIVTPAPFDPTTPLRTTAIVSWGTGANMNTLECDWLGGASLSLPGTTCTVDVMVDPNQAASTTLPILLRASATCQRTVRGGRTRATRTFEIPATIAVAGVFDVAIPKFSRAWSALTGQTGAEGAFDAASFWDFHGGLPIIAANRMVRFTGTNASAIGKISNNPDGAWMPGSASHFRFTRGGAVAMGAYSAIMFHLDP